MKRLLFGALSVGLVVGFAAACTSDPTEVLRGGVSRVTLSQSFVQILRRCERSYGMQKSAQVRRKLT